MELSEISKEIEKFYRTSEIFRRHEEEKNEDYYKNYVNFILNYCTKRIKILDLGCGAGLSSYLLSQNGFQVVGIDISPLFAKSFSYKKNNNLSFVVANATHIPFSRNFFDVVTSNQLIEHIPNVQMAIDEMSRVLKIGGLIIIFAPNLCNPIIPLYDFVRLCMGKKGRPVWAETRTQALFLFIKNLSFSLIKKFSKNPIFLFRTPDLTYQKTVGRDSDSVYLANQIDLKKYLQKLGFQILNLGRSTKIIHKFLPSFAEGIAIVAQKIS